MDNDLGYYRFAYNSSTFYRDSLGPHERLPHGKHDLYFEAVIGAIYLDGEFEEAAKWIYGKFKLDGLEDHLRRMCGEKKHTPVEYWPRYGAGLVSKP